MKSWSLFASATALVALLAGGCSTLDERQREWIFQPSDRSWGNSEAMSQGMEDVWIDFKSPLTGEPARLHGLWLGGAPESADTPVMLYLHGARYNVAGSAPRMRRMHELVGAGSQFVIATHSPVLLAYPGALIYELGEDGPVPTAYEDTDHFQMTRAFLESPERFLRRLFDEP